MGTGAITGYVDVAQLVLYAFWAFFFALIFWLQRESKREGYPMVSDRPGRETVEGLLPMPRPKTYLLEGGGEVVTPRGGDRPAAPDATPIGAFPGASLVPNGDQLGSGMGPGTISNRHDHPERSFAGTLVLQPMRALTEFRVAERCTDPRGLPVLGADGEPGGTIRDIWIDGSDAIVRYLEADVPAAGGGTRRALVPLNFCRIGEDAVRVQALLGEQFAGIPGLREPDSVTLLEEEKITAYFGAGTLYATRERQEALL